MIKKISLVLLLMPISLCSMEKRQPIDVEEEPKEVTSYKKKHQNKLTRSEANNNLFKLYKDNLEKEPTELTGQPCLAVVELYKKFLEEEKNGVKEYTGINDDFLHSVTLSNLYRMFVEDMEAEKEAEEKANDEVKK